MNDTLLTCPECNCQYLISKVLVTSQLKVRCTECGCVWMPSAESSKNSESSATANSENVTAEIEMNASDNDKKTNAISSDDIEQTLTNIKNSLKKEMRAPFIGSLKNQKENQTPANSQKQEQVIDIEKMIQNSMPVENKTTEEKVVNYFETIKNDWQEKEEFKPKKSNFFSSNKDKKDSIAKKAVTKTFSFLMIISILGNIFFWAFYFLQFSQHWLNFQKYFQSLIK